MSRLCSVVLLLALACCAAGVSARAPARGHLFSPPATSGAIPAPAPLGEGKGCIECELILSLIEQFALDNNYNLTVAADTWCTDVAVELPSYAASCENKILPMVNAVAADFAAGRSPDYSCRTTLAQCPFPACNLFGTWPPPPHESQYRLGTLDGSSRLARHQHAARVSSNFLNIHQVTEEVIKAVNARADEAERRGLVNPEGHWIPVPIPDWDSDGYGTAWGYRGLQFRGDDCDDADGTTYPGRDASKNGYDPVEGQDSNCNGISGSNSAGEPYEAEWCRTPSRGVMAIGDSATAHFSLPPSFITAGTISPTTYARLIQDGVTELDWPECSATTGWANATVCPYSLLPPVSVYDLFRQRNLCGHRDYANLGVNGESVDTLVVGSDPVTNANYSGNLQAIPPRFAADGPSTVFYALIGNDICHAKPWGGNYTSTSVFAQKALEELTYLDSKLAPGSHVIITGVIDGRVLFDTLQDAWHPIGTPYPMFYDYLNCIQTSPCWGWMNSNETIRNASSAQAAVYNQVWADIIANNKFVNFDAHYFEFDIFGMVQGWVAAGHKATDLIEPTDGFHPSQTANMLLAQSLFSFLENQVPEALPQINPHNADILAMFGDQGSYGY